MAIFAKVLDGVVVEVLNAEAGFFDTYIDSSPGNWIETFKNASGDASKRYNYAGVGRLYDAQADAFYSAQPFDSWTLNTTTYLWEPPVAYPADNGAYTWNEDTQTWDAVE
tara:strand:+ start:181 stop:510 length:330 start_codon:yes stop_codon:yes gene_type:complete